ncbi:MAG: CDP-alcohol phosphatidyltransferase family protein [Verrucomicrobia bacterium]|nr:CDP-alcohol phosphatidyltransferase family protein [Verrucomicrobiota bacterium]
MTTANKITIFRILLVPFFIVQVLYYLDTGREYHRWLAFLSFAIAAICDGVDGYVARRYNQRSELGAILDPLADKLLLVSGVVLLSMHNQPYLDQIPWWLTATIIGRDVILALGLGVIHFTGGNVKVRPHFIGKMATVFQMIVVIWILLRWHYFGLRVWIWGAGICTAVSGMIYVFEGIRRLSASPTSAATPGQNAQRGTPDHRA